MSKNIVICFDGTGNDFNGCISNIAKVAALCKYDSNQLIFYSPGVGTDNIVFHKFKDFFGETFGKAFGYGIGKLMIFAYIFLVNHYSPGDKVYIFGFSRGAYTARSFASVIYKCDILRPENVHLVNYIAKMYLSKEKPNALFKHTFCNACTPHFLGVWDTVDSRGEFDKQLYPMDITLHPDISYAYQALAIDEKRYMFKPVLLNEDKIDSRVVEQVWFAGCHSDVGGGNPSDRLSDISLKWMLTKAKNCGLNLIDTWETALKPKPGYMSSESYEGFYKIWKPVLREIPEYANIHQSVFDRIKIRRDYRPSNLPKNYSTLDE